MVRVEIEPRTYSWWTGDAYVGAVAIKVHLTGKDRTEMALRDVERRDVAALLESGCVPNPDGQPNARVEGLRVFSIVFATVPKNSRSGAENNDASRARQEPLDSLNVKATYAGRTASGERLPVEILKRQIERVLEDWCLPSLGGAVTCWLLDPRNALEAGLAGANRDKSILAAFAFRDNVAKLRHAR